MNYKPYGNEATTPSRRARKALRNSVFQNNRNLKRLADRAKRKERKEAQGEVA